MLENLRKEPVFRSMLVLILGLVLLDFLFSLLFGSSNVMQRYLGLTSVLVELLLLLMVGAFFYGLYKVFQENVQPILAKLAIQNHLNSTCNKCGKNLLNGWKCCPICGSDVKHEGSKN